eukprot:scaffold258_cov354-Prasinococcus_capsulatus_cf.AAC.9
MPTSNPRSLIVTIRATKSFERCAHLRKVFLQRQHHNSRGLHRLEHGSTLLRPRDVSGMPVAVNFVLVQIPGTDQHALAVGVQKICCSYLQGVSAILEGPRQPYFLIQ